jgi:hypothetical protein
MPTLDEVQAALQSCMTAQPPVDYDLSPDASQLATVFAEMRFAGERVRDMAALKPKQLDALGRWGGSGQGGHHG